MAKYYNDYPTKPIGGSNPYHCCAYCGVSQPAINGDLENHLEWCEYPRIKTLEQELERAKLEIECLRLDVQRTVYCVAVGWYREPKTLKIFWEEDRARQYARELEEDDFNHIDCVVYVEPLSIS